MKNFKQKSWFSIISICFTFGVLISFFYFPQFYMAQDPERFHPKSFFYIVLPILFCSTFLSISTILHTYDIQRKSLTVGFSLASTFCIVAIGVGRLFLPYILYLMGSEDIGAWKWFPFAIIFGLFFPLGLVCACTFVIIDVRARIRNSKSKKI